MGVQLYIKGECDNFKNMSKQPQSAFKQLYAEMFNQGGDFNKVNKDLKKNIKCYVKESFPHFLVSDGFFYVNAYFTK